MKVSFPIPGTLKDFLVLTRLNKGGMANVYLGQGMNDPSRWVAIKTLLPDLAQKRKFISMFHNEGMLGKMLQHPNIVETLDVGRLGEGDESLYFLILGYVHGRDLGAVARYFRKRKKKMPPEIVLHVAEQVLRGLYHAHTLEDESGQPLHLVNRDVSPANVMVGFDGQVKLIDFGIAQATLDFRSQIGSIRGKISYMSPEQVRGLPVEARSDLFSLSVVLYQLLTGVEPFDGDSEFEQMEMIRTVEPPKPSEYVPGLPPELDALVLKGLSKTMADRFWDAEEMREEVLKVQALLPKTCDQDSLSTFMRRAFAADMDMLQRRVNKAHLILHDRGQEVIPSLLYPGVGAPVVLDRSDEELSIEVSKNTLTGAEPPSTEEALHHTGDGAIHREPVLVLQEGIDNSLDMPLLDIESDRFLDNPVSSASLPVFPSVDESSPSSVSFSQDDMPQVHVVQEPETLGAPVARIAEPSEDEEPKSGSSSLTWIAVIVLAAALVVFVIHSLVTS